ncbi:MAG: helix-turn-helix transcriptional regulator [Bacteroidales bacterium]|nr:helix-turn-helix transcriptional regulator [Bacteroidales bacterium]
MKRIFTIHLMLRVLPVALFIMLFMLDLATKEPDGMEMRLCCYLLAAAVIYIAYPLTRDDPMSSARFSAVCSLYYLGAALALGETMTVEYLFLLPTVVFTLIYAVRCMMCKYKEPSAIFRKDAAWCCAEEDSRTVYSFFILASCVGVITLVRCDADAMVMLAASVFLLVLDILLHVRAYSGRTIMIGERKERRIQTILLTSGRMSDAIPEVDNAILSKSYRRIEQFMRDHKPYLDDRFTMEKMADTLKLNKVYISRAINKFTSKNFRQYVNWHRVLYSVELMRADPWLKVIELAFMSGFHSQVTYNMCFKIFMDETPSDMLSRLRLQKPRPELSKIEVKLPPDEVVPSSRDEGK